MPLPLPTLDTRRWADLVEEARTLVPRLSPAWTEHNLSDPGMTLLELLAWVVEQDVYRVDQIPERHRRAFLRLLGLEAAPPQPARVPVAFELRAGETELTLPEGTVVAASSGGRSLRFRTLGRLVALPVTLAAVQRSDGESFEDVTRLWREGLPFELSESLLLGFETPLPQDRPLSVWVAVEGGAGAEAERRAIREEQAALRAALRRLEPGRRCAPAEPPPPCPDPALAHHSVRLAWELNDGTDWVELAAEDTTRGLTLDGVVRLRPAMPAPATAVGALAQPLHWVRCRVAAGTHDEAPVVLDLAVNTVETEQRSRVRQTLSIAAGTPAPSPPPELGPRRRVDLEFDDEGDITHLDESSAQSAPAVRILEYDPPDATEEGRLSATLALVGVGRGTPGQRLRLGEAPVSRGRLGLWTREEDGWRRWDRVPAFEGRGAGEQVFVLDPQLGEARFGDGEHGRVPPPGCAIVAAFEVTAAAAGNVPGASDWTLAGADDALNAALLGDPAAIAGRLQAIRARRAAAGGSDAESLPQVFGRAAETLWAHERLLELAPAPGGSLDGLDPEVVRGRTAPWRAATALDFERLALAVPGTRVRRARAWAGIDPAHPCLRAPGTVTVVVVPGSPRGRPHPSEELITAVRRFLERRKTVGTRLAVVGPDYVEVTVATTLRVAAGADPDAVSRAGRRALDDLLDPIHGGPSGRGWPFGRDVFRAELLAVLDGVTGVDHVERLELSVAGGESRCDDVCVGRTQLVVSGDHAVEALR